MSVNPWSPNAVIRRLPFPVAPILDETVESYIRRLAEENNWFRGDLDAYIRYGDSETPVSADRLSAISGLPAQTLRTAMLELCTPADLNVTPKVGRPRPGGIQQAGCRRCLRGRRVQRWVRHEDDIVCLRHRCLLDGRPRDLTDFPEIWQANRRHRLLIRRYGREPVRQAFEDAEGIVAAWDERNQLDAPYRRQARMVGDKYWRLRWDDQLKKAVRYPETVALTRLLVTPQWRSLALFGHRLRPDDTRLMEPGADCLDPATEVVGRRYIMSTRNKALKHFLKELRRSVIARYVWSPTPHHGGNDPLVDWVIEQLDRSYGFWEPVVGELRQRVPETFA